MSLEDRLEVLELDLIYLENEARTLRERIRLATREPLSDSDIYNHTPFHYHDAEQKAFAVGVRFAEKEHGITGVDDE